MEKKYTFSLMVDMREIISLGKNMIIFVDGDRYEGEFVKNDI